MCGMAVGPTNRAMRLQGGCRDSKLWVKSQARARLPPESLRAAAEIVAKSLAKLCQSGVPIVALRALAAALVAIGRHRGASTFAEAWSVQDLALGFLIGALKSEWRSVKYESPCAMSLEACVAALKERFGVSRESQRRTQAFDLVFCESGL